MARPTMPQVSAWANELREVFGADDVNSAIKTHGYYAAENGVEMGSRVDLTDSVSLAQMVVRKPTPEAAPRGR
jgi:hypothetical protein